MNYCKLRDAISPNWVTFYKHSNRESFNFTVGYDLSGNIKSGNCVKRISDEGYFTVNPDRKPSSITKDEFESEFKKFVEFLSKNH